MTRTSSAVLSPHEDILRLDNTCTQLAHCPNSHTPSAIRWIRGKNQQTARFQTWAETRLKPSVILNINHLALLDRRFILFMASAWMSHYTNTTNTSLRFFTVLTLKCSYKQLYSTFFPFFFFFQMSFRFLDIPHAFEILWPSGSVTGVFFCSEPLCHAGCASKASTVEPARLTC